jgi:hypothetical protein
MHTTDNEARREKRIHNYRGSGPGNTSVSISFVFFAFHLMENQWNLTTARFSGYLGDDENGQQVSDNIYASHARVYRWSTLRRRSNTQYGFVAGLQGINLLALAYNLIKVRR